MASSSQPSTGVPSSTTAIDFTRDTSTSSQTIILAVPQDGDSLEVIAQKMNDIGNVIRAGKSVAVATNFKGMAHYKLDPTVLAMHDMTPVERSAYEVYLSEQLVLPPMIWNTMKEKAFTGENTKKRNNARIEAIRLLYCYPEATGEHLAYITKHMEHTVLPLIKAIVRAVNVKKDLRGGKDIDIEEWAEFQCLKHIQSTTARLQQQHMEQIKRLKLEVKAAMDVLGSREKGIRASLRASGISPPEVPDVEMDEPIPLGPLEKQF